MELKNRTAFQGTERGSIVQFTPIGVHMRLRGSREIVFIMHRHLDPVGFKAHKTKPAKRITPPKATKPKAAKVSKPTRVELGVRVVKITDAVRFKGQLDSIGKATVNK